MKRIKASLFVALFAPAFASAQEKEFAAQWAQLRQIERQTDKKVCREAFRALVSQSPNDNFLRVKEAWCSMPSDETWNALRGIAVVRPQLPWPQLGMARVYRFWKMSAPAAELLSRVLKGHPKFFPALFELGEMARHEGRLVEAKAFYEKALGIHDEALAHAGLGLVELAQGRMDSAAKSLESAYTRDAQEIFVVDALFRLNVQRGDLTQSVAYLFQKAQLQPHDVSTWKEVARLSLANDAKPEATVALEKLIELKAANAATFEALQRLYFQLEKLDEEEKVLEAWLSYGSIETTMVLRLIDLAKRKNDLKQAEVHLSNAVARLDDPQLRLELGRVQRHLQRFVDALENYRKAAIGQGETAQTAQKELLELRAFLGVSEKPLRGTPQRVFAAIEKKLKRFCAEMATDQVFSDVFVKGRIHLDEKGRLLDSAIDEDTLNDARLVSHVLVQLKEAMYESKAAEVVFEFRLNGEKRPQ